MISTLNGLLTNYIGVCHNPRRLGFEFPCFNSVLLMNTKYLSRDYYHAIWARVAVSGGGPKKVQLTNQSVWFRPQNSRSMNSQWRVQSRPIPSYFVCVCVCVCVSESVQVLYWTCCVCTCVCVCVCVLYWTWCYFYWFLLGQTFKWRENNWKTKMEKETNKQANKKK